MNTTPHPTHIHHHRAIRPAVLAVALVGTFGLTSCMGESANPPAHDIDPGWQCVADPAGGVRSTGTVTNHSSKTSFYVIDLEVKRGKEVVASGSVSVDGVESGETVRIDTLLDDGNVQFEGSACTVTNIERFKA
jgi:hypothetical protein